MAKQNKKLPISIFEIVWYALCAAVALWGLVYIVLGLVAEYANVAIGHNTIREASLKFAETFKLGFFGWGLIMLAVACVCAVFVLCVNAKSSDREQEKAARRAARLGIETPKEE